MEFIPIPGAELYYGPHFFQPEEAIQLFNTLLSKCAWERRKAHLEMMFPATKPTMAIPERTTHTRGGCIRRSLGYRNYSL